MGSATTKYVVQILRSKVDPFMLIEHVDDVIILLFGKQGRLLISNQSYDLVIEESSVLFDDAIVRGVVGLLSGFHGVHQAMIYDK